MTEKAVTPVKRKTRSRKVFSKDRDELILQYAPTIKHLALRISMRLPSHIDLDDLINAGVIGLMDAIEKFDPDKGVRFETYAEFRIRGAILDELRAQDWVSRSIRQKANQLSRTYADLEHKLGRAASDEEVMESLGVDQDTFHRLLDQVRSISLVNWEEITGREKVDSSGGDGGGAEGPADFHKGADLFRDLNLRRVRQVLQNAIESLPEKERIVVSLYYYADLNMKEIGEVLAITESRISQIHTKAILRLRGKLLNYFS